jgi:TonB family protein
VEHRDGYFLAAPDNGGAQSRTIARSEGAGTPLPYDKPPVLLFKREPDYSEVARKAKYQGTVLLYVEVDEAGKSTNIKVARSLGLGLDEKAVEAVRQWVYKSATKDGKPIAVPVTVEVNFRLP